MTHLHSGTDAAFHSQSASNAETELQALRQQYLALETEYNLCREELNRLQAKADRLEEHLHLVQDSYDLMVNSSGHRLLEKYYTLRRMLSPAAWKTSIANKFAPFVHKLHHIKNKRTHQLTQDDKYLILSTCRRIDLITDESHRTAAQQFQRILSRAGIDCDIHLSPPEKYADCPYIILGNQTLNKLPDVFMTFCSTAPTNAQCPLLLNAYAVFVSDLEIITVIQETEGLSSRVFYMPLDNDALEYHLYRYLLAVDRITFDRFYEEVGSHIHLSGDRICLSLPETVERRASFDADNRYGFEVFPGLKHHIGWIGCGMSYKMIFRKAMEQRLGNIIVCEDDVYFPSDFNERFERILKYTETHDDWMIFSGIMGDLGDVSVLNHVRESHEDFVYLNKMMSMVFNIYTPALFETLSQWDIRNRNKNTNTIDRYLEDKCRRVLTTCPFLVGHKEDLNSTIWNHKNDLYNPGIENSSKKLMLLLDAYHYYKKQ